MESDECLMHNDQCPGHLPGRSLCIVNLYCELLKGVLV